MKNRKIRKAAAAMTAALSVYTSTVCPALARESRNPSAAPMVKTSGTSLTSGHANYGWHYQLGEQVDKYNLWPGCEYIMKLEVSNFTYVYEPVRVIDRYEEERKFLWIPFTNTMALGYLYDWGEEKLVDCNEVLFFYSKEPLHKED